MLLKNYLKGCLLSILSFMIQGKGSSENNLILNSGEKFISCVWFSSSLLGLTNLHMWVEFDMRAVKVTEICIHYVFQVLFLAND